jgi:arabinan endo-1,5-alpha-L-arabinosidase
MRFALLDRLLNRTTDQPGGPAPIAPVIDRDFPDPDVLTVDGGYYAYSTNSIYDGALVHVPVARAAALTGPWTSVGDALPTLPGWAAPGPTVWAPELAEAPGGGYLLFFTARHAARGVQCIGVAGAPDPAGPFQPIGTDAVIGATDDGDSIDAETATGPDGTRYLIYKSGRTSSTMWLQRLAADGYTPEGPRTALIHSDRPEEANIVEAPSLVRHGGRYVLFYSANTFDSGRYFVNYATAAHLSGPYVKAPGQLLNRDTIGGAYRNPGHEDVVSTPDGDRIVFHASLDATTRALFVAALGWTDGGRPSVRPLPPAGDDARA